MVSPNKPRVAIFLSIFPWGFSLDYLQKLSYALHEYSDILFFFPYEPSVDIWQSLYQKEKRARLIKSLLSYGEHYTLYIPFSFIPLNHIAIIRHINSFITNFLLCILLFFKLKNKITYTYTTYPFSSAFIRYFNTDYVIYDCMEYPSFADNNKRDAMVKQNHQELVTYADIVFVNSSILKKMCAPFNKNVYKIPSGFVLKPFISGAQYKVPSDYLHISSPRIGFVGSTFVRLDIDLLNYLAKTNPSLSFIFIGTPTENVHYSNQTSKSITYFYKNWKKLIAHKNVYRVEKVARTELPHYIYHLDVCMIPYDIKQIPSLYANTIKAYEYLALGKSIVSTNIKPLQDLKNVISFASTPKQFSQKIYYELHKKTTKNEVMKKRKIALCHDTENKAKIAMKYIAEYIDSKVEKSKHRIQFFTSLPSQI